jgi:hypothetical protein
MLKRVLLFSLLSLLATGCIKENLDNCVRGIRLQFRYIHNNQNADLLSEQVQNIRIYLFDQNTGVLVDIISVGTQDIARGYVDIDINDGLYTVVTWGGSSTNMMQGGYIDAQATNPAANTYIPVAIGTTTLDNFRMMLAYDPLSDNALASAIPKVANFGDLFYASVTNISVVMGRNRQTVNLDMIKNTCTLKVVITGLNYLSSRATLPDLPIEVFSTGKNWLYDYINNPDIYAPRMLYLPYENSLNTDADEMEVLIKQQRLNINQSVLDPVLLYIRSTIGANLISPLNIIEAIRQNPVYQTQSAIDREDLFTITIAIEPSDSVNLTVTITINGWVIAHTETILL